MDYGGSWVQIPSGARIFATFSPVSVSLFSLSFFFSFFVSFVFGFFVYFFLLRLTFTFDKRVA